MCDASLRADAGHRADDRVFNCAHRIEARVARSRGDSALFFQKSGRSTPSHTPLYSSIIIIDMCIMMELGYEEFDYLLQRIS